MNKRWIGLLLIIILGIGWFAPLKAQAAEEMVMHQVEDRVNGTVSQYYYDEAGRVVRKVDGEGDYETYEYYLTNGLLQTSYRYLNHKPLRFARYDSCGNKQLIVSWDTMQGTIRYHRYYNTYDPQGRLLTVRYTESLDKELLILTKETYEYMDDTGMYMVTTERFRNETDTEPSHIRYTYYDSEDRMVGDESYEYTTGYGFVTSNIYDEQGNLTSRYQSESAENQHNEHSSTYYNKYNTAGRLVEQVCEYTITYGSFDEATGSWTTETEEGKTRYKYQYDSKGRLTKEVIYVENDLLSTNTWKYDKYGNLLKRTSNGYTEEEYRYTYVPLSKALWKNDK